MPPIFFTLGYLLAVIAFSSTWAFAIALAHAHVFRPLDGSSISVAALGSLGAVSLLGVAAFTKLAKVIRGRTAANVGRAVCVSAALVWALVLIGSREVAAIIGPATVFLIFGGVVALHRAVGQIETSRVFAAMATLAALVVSAVLLFFGLPHFIGMIACCVLLSYRILRLWWKRAASAGGNLRELFIAVSLVAVSIGFPLSVLRAAYPPYSQSAIIVPLDRWEGGLRVRMRYFDVWLEYPKSRLSPEQRAWFSTRHTDGHFYKKLGADLRPRVAMEGRAEKPLDTPLVVVSDTHDWLGESLDTVLAGASRDSVILLDRTATEKLGRLGARLVVDVPNNLRVKNP